MTRFPNEYLLQKENATTETLQLMRLNFTSLSSEFKILTDSVSKITLLLKENINGLLLLPHDEYQHFFKLIKIYPQD